MNEYNIRERMNEILADDLKKMTEIEEFLKNAPEGFIDAKQRKNSTSFIKCDKNTDGKKTASYLSKESMSLIKALAKKSYFTKLKPVLAREINALKRCRYDVDIRAKERIYDELVDWKRQLVVPLFETPAMKVQKWLDIPYSPYLEHKDNLIAQTKKGEWRRSKSEADISNELDSLSDKLLYRYEPELWLPPYKMAVHPDFEIMVLETGEKFYWEHVGGFHKEGYSQSFVQKIHLYNSNGIVTDKNLILTFEHGNMYLLPWMIRQGIERMIGEY